MRLARLSISHVVVALFAASMAGCGSFKNDDSPTGPSTVTPPQAGAVVQYTAIGASDANGVGSSVPCLPFAPCEDGTGYVPVLARQLRASRQVTVLNLGIPASVLGPSMETLARAYGREVTGNFLDRQMPFVPRETTLVTIVAGGNDVNAVGDAIAGGAAGNDIPGYIGTQARLFGVDYDRLVSGVRSRAPGAFIVIANVPNMAGLPYAARYPLQDRRVLQAVSIALSREANRQAGGSVAVLDLMCDASMYEPSRYSSDGFHPSDTGYAQLASRMAAIVNGGPAPVATTCPSMTIVPPL